MRDEYEICIIRPEGERRTLERPDRQVVVSKTVTSVFCVNWDATGNLSRGRASNAADVSCRCVLSSSLAKTAERQCFRKNGARGNRAWVGLFDRFRKSESVSMSSQPGKARSATPGRRHRRHPRYRSEFAVTVTLLAGNQYQTLEAHCKDLSEAGIGALIAAEVPMGEVVSLNFSLPGLTEAWEVRAVLRHRRGFHYGFEFLSLERERTTALKKYIENLPRVD